MFKNNSADDLLELKKRFASVLEDSQQLPLTPKLTKNGIEPLSFIAYLEDKNGNWEQTTVTGQSPVPLDPMGLISLKRHWERKAFSKPDPRIKRGINEPHRGYWVYSFPYSGRPSMHFIDDILPIKEDYMHGWMQRYLIRNEIEINGRWDYYAKIQAKLDKEVSIPYLNWKVNEDSILDKQCLELLYYCLNEITTKWNKDARHKWAGVNYLFDWILWSLGHPCCKEFPLESNYNPEPSLQQEGVWDGDAHSRLLQVFDTNYFLLGKNDYFGEFLHTLSDEHKKFPKQKPLSEIDDWFRQTLLNQEEDELFLFVDPCVDTGRTMMVASNYTLSLVGSNEVAKDQLITKAALINFYLFIPWAIKPSDVVNSEEMTGSTSKEQVDLFFTNSLPVLLKELYGLPEDYFYSIQEVSPTDDYYPITLVNFEKPSKQAKLSDLLPPFPQTPKKPDSPVSSRTKLDNLLGSTKSDRKLDELLPPPSSDRLSASLTSSNSESKLKDLLPPSKSKLGDLLAPKSPEQKLSDLLPAKSSEQKLSDLLPADLTSTSSDRKLDDLLGGAPNPLPEQSKPKAIEPSKTQGIDNLFNTKKLEFEELNQDVSTNEQLP